MPAASLQHSDSPTLEVSDNHRIRQVALANQPTTQEADSLVNLLRRPLLLSALNQPNLDLALVILAAASLAKNLERLAAYLDKITRLQHHSKVVASSVLQEEQLAASAQELPLGPDLALEVVFLVATINSSSSNNRSRSHSVRQLPPLEEGLGLVVLGSAPTTITRIPAVVVYSAIVVRPTLLLGNLSSSQPNRTRSAALGLKPKTNQITSRPSEASVLSSNKSKSQADYLAPRLRIILGEVVCLGT